MNTLTLRRRWLVVRPWVIDTIGALGFIAFCVAVFAGLGYGADLLRTWGWLA